MLSFFISVKERQTASASRSERGKVGVEKRSCTKVQ